MSQLDSKDWNESVTWSDLSISIEIETNNSDIFKPSDAML